MTTGIGNEERTGPGQVNRLAQEPSLYLRQHATNPVDWYPWGEEALTRARVEDRPIFLSVGYASCHWCHVMEREVFEDPTVAEALNARFVCIKVDREERPDLDALYMEAVQALTGSGGWPMSVFLTPALRPFHGGTYFPREVFLVLVTRLHELFAHQRSLVETQAEQVRQVLGRLPELRSGGVMRPEWLTDAIEQAERAFDHRWGGWRGRMKFPTPPRWSFLLHLHRLTGDPRPARLVRTTLDAMASGGIHDQLGGGFHRYAVEPTWMVPHFEKMLYDNAQLASLYLEAAATFQEPRYAAVGQATLEFIRRELQGRGGGCYASLDADDPLGEGTCYTWTEAELGEVAGPEEGARLARLFGVTPTGNHEGRTVLGLREGPGAPAGAEQAALLARWRGPLLERRGRRPQPTPDRKIVTGWTGLAIAALAQGALYLEQPELVADAVRAADYLWTHHRDAGGRLLRASYEGQPARSAAILEDHVWLVQGLLLLYQAGGGPEQLRRALELIEVVRGQFRHPGLAAGYALTAADHPLPEGARPADLFDAVTPSGSSAFLHVLLQAAALTGRRELEQEVAEQLDGAASLLDRAGLELAGWLDALLLLRSGMRAVVVAGEPGWPSTRNLMGVIGRQLLPHVVLSRSGAAGPEPILAALAPPTQGKTAARDVAQAWVCTRDACRAPTGDPGELERHLRPELATAC